MGICQTVSIDIQRKIRYKNASLEVVTKRDTLDVVLGRYLAPSNKRYVRLHTYC